MKVYQAGTVKNGNLSLPSQQFLDKVATLPDGEVLLIVEHINPNKTLAEYKKEYGAKRDFLCREVGEDRKSMDLYIKEYVLAHVLEDRENRLFDSFSVSKRDLSLLGWKVFIESLRLWAWSNYNVYL